jgi:hypothetical protein
MTIMDYIRSSGGTIVTINTVKEKTGLNEVYANNVLKEIRSNPMVESRKDENNRRATYYKLKEEIPVVPAAPAEIKMHKKYKNLTEDQVGYIQSVLAKQSVDSSFDMLMAIMNALAGFGGAHEFINKYAEKISDLLIIKNVQVRLYADLLQKAGLLLIDSNRARLTLGDEPVESIIKPIAAEPVPEKTEYEAPVKEAAASVEDVATVTSTPELKPEAESTAHVKEPVKETVQETVVDTTVPSELESTLVANMESFKGFIGQFQNFIGDMINQVSRGSKSEIEELKTLLSDQDKENAELKNEIVLYKKQLDDGNTNTKRLLEENSNLKEALNKKIDENRANKKLIEAHKEANDNVFAAMQERFQILLADINNTITDYTRIPAWQITSSNTARVQSEIINAVTAAMKDLLDSNCATIVE